MAGFCSFLLLSCYKVTISKGLEAKELQSRGHFEIGSFFEQVLQMECPGPFLARLADSHRPRAASMERMPPQGHWRREQPNNSLKIQSEDRPGLRTRSIDIHKFISHSWKLKYIRLSLFLVQNT